MGNQAKRDRIVYIPYYSQGAKSANHNEYTLNMVDILKDRYYVTGDLAKLTDIGQISRTKAVFLNWVEGERLDRKLKSTLFFYQLLGVKLIWVFHNKYPHDAMQNDRMTNNMKWLADHSNIIVLHSKSSKRYIPDIGRNGKKAIYIPHILYQSHGSVKSVDDMRKRYGITDTDFIFTVFGSIRPYKNIEKGIEIFKKLHLDKAKLLIAGRPFNNDYAKKILDMCMDDDNIILDLRYLPDAELDAVLSLSDVILIPYKDESSMNSGVMIQAFSKGKTVIIPDICMAKDLASYNFFYIYHTALEQAMLEAYKRGKAVNRSMGARAKQYIYQNNNRDAVRKNIYKMLKGD